MKNISGLLFDLAMPQSPMEVEIENASFNKLRALICARSAAYIYLPDKGKTKNKVMLVDEEGLMLKRKVNEKATDYLVRVMDTPFNGWMPIVGNAFVCDRSDLALLPFILEGEVDTQSVRFVFDEL